MTLSRKAFDAAKEQILTQTGSEYTHFAVSAALENLAVKYMSEDLGFGESAIITSGKKLVVVNGARDDFWMLDNTLLKGLNDEKHRNHTS